MSEQKIRAIAQKPGDEVPTEILASAIREISEGMRKMRAGRLNDRALILLIHDVCKVSKTDIKYVINAIGLLEREFLKGATK